MKHYKRMICVKRLRCNIMFKLSCNASVNLAAAVDLELTFSCTEEILFCKEVFDRKSLSPTQSLFLVGNGAVSLLNSCTLARTSFC